MSDYVFENNPGDEERLRLRRIEAALDARSRQLIERSGLTTGWRCLEVGAGGGSILRWLGERVGTGGHAVGIDKNVAHLGSFAGAPFEIVEADVREFDRPGTFDLVHARYVLIHNRDPDVILRHLRRLLKPGGYLLLEEPDFESAEWLDPEYREACERVNRAIRAMFKGLSLDPGFGKRMPILVSAAGLSIRHIEDCGHLESGGGPVATFMSDSARALRDKYVATEQAVSADIDRYIQAALDSASWAIYYSTVRVVAVNP